MTDLVILYEHPQWFVPLFEALDRRGVSYRAIHADGFAFDPGEMRPPAPVIFNRIAMSSFLRAPEHPIFHAAAALAHWRDRGARVLNGAEVVALDASKARQLSLIAGLGIGIPKTRVVHRAADLAAAASDLHFPIVVKANIGGSGAGIVRYDDPAMLAAAIADGSVPTSVDCVLLAQEYVPARDGLITRIETLAGRFLYAIAVNGGGGFDLCPADACDLPDRPAIAIERVDPDPKLIAFAEAIVKRAGIDVGGVEVLIDDRDGTPLFYDINALSNFVANPLDVLGFDPHEQLVDWLEAQIAEAKA